MGYFNRTGLSARARVGSGLALVGCLALAPGSARAASPLPELWTVCASGCSFSSLSQAVTDAAVHSGDGLEVLPDKIYTEQVSVTKRLDIFAAADGPRPEITWAGANGTTLAITSGGAGTTITHLDIRATGLAGTALNAAGAVSASDLALTTSGVGASLAGLDAQLGPDVTATVTGNGGTAIDAAAGASVTGLTVNANLPGTYGVVLQDGALLSDATVTADTALATFGGTTRRATLNGGAAGVLAGPATVASVVSDSVATSTAAGGRAAVALAGLEGSTGIAALSLRNVTAVAVGGGSSGLEAQAYEGPPDGRSSGAINARNVIARGGGADVQADPAASQCTVGDICRAGRVTVGYSNFLSISGSVDTGTVGNNQHAVPQLVNPVVGAGQDFHIANAGSPLIAAGIADPSDGARDRDGLAHPSPPSIGAYEFVAPPATAGPGPQPGPGPLPAGGPAPAAPGLPLASKATISLLRETNAVFAVGASSTPLTAQTATAHKRGTVFSFGLDQPATVKIAIQSTTPGRRIGGRCAPETRSRRSKPRCQHTTTIASLTRSGHVGLNQVPFSGRIRRAALKPGGYRASLTAADAAGTSAAKTLRFTIVKA